MILCDTNIFIEIYRNNQSIIQTIKHIGQQNVAVSDVTRAELFFGARNKKELQVIRKDMDKLIVFPVDVFISDKAVKLVELYSLSHKLALPDALIGDTAIYHKIELYTLNVKDFLFLDEVKLFSL
ncbi:MAG TPA: type II toxin-antitoxin system VapC family toxin [Hanamia sp.]|nr:type II toxin-antitoxin system VapC family toxin [Hanamia sp.]